MTPILQGILMCRDFFTGYPFTVPPLNGKSALKAKLGFLRDGRKCAAAKSAGDGGNRPATHTTDAHSRPFDLCRLQSERIKSVPLSPRGFLRGERGGGERGIAQCGSRFLIPTHSVTRGNQSRNSDL